MRLAMRRSLASFAHAGARRRRNQGSVTTPQQSLHNAPRPTVTTNAADNEDKAAARLKVDDLVAIKPMRIDNFLMQEGLCLRREARQFCREHEIVAALSQSQKAELQRVLTGGTKVDPSTVRIDGERKPYVFGPIALHKPAGYVCSHDEPGSRTVYELLKPEFQLRNPVYSTIGRLDKQATGLILLSQNGLFNNRLTSPRKAVPKEYVVSLEEPLSEQLTEVQALASGRIKLADGALARPAVLVPHNSNRRIAKVILAEGRHHQLRRMFAAVGHSVMGIHRIGFGGLRLPDLNLKEGQWRLLTREEIQTLLDNSCAVLAPEQGAKPAAGPAVKVRGASLADYIASDDDGEGVLDNTPTDAAVYEDDDDIDHDGSAASGFSGCASARGRRRRRHVASGSG